MAIVTDSATALAIIESWDWNDVWNFHAECEMPLMLQLSEVINQLAMEGHYDSAGATLSLLAEGKLIATGSFRWKAFRNGHYQREGTGRIPAHRWSVLQDARAACDDPFFPNETTLRLLDGNWGERKEELFVWSWDKDWFSTAQTAKGDWLDEGYFEETYTNLHRS